MKYLFDGVLAVLFDMDGTLVETNIDFGLMKREMLDLASEYGIPASDLAALDILGIVRAATERLELTYRYHESRSLRTRAFTRLEEIEVRHSENAFAIDGALDLLAMLKESGIRVGIVTRNCRRAVEISMRRTGVWADVLLTRDDVPKTKPDPDHLLHALDLLNVGQGDAVMIGDHWMDVMAGRAAGMRTVGFLRPDRHDGFFDSCAPDLLIRDLMELSVHIHRLIQ
jgi:phosphoglycolate phosphatase